MNLQNLKQVVGHLGSVQVLLPETSQEEERDKEEEEEVEEEAEKGCEGSGAGQPNFLGADDVAEPGLDLQEMPLELQPIALRGERQGFNIPLHPPAPLHPLAPTSHRHPHPAPPCTHFTWSFLTTHPDPTHTLERRKSTKILLSISTRFTLKMSLLFLLSVVEMVTCKGGVGRV